MKSVFDRALVITIMLLAFQVNSAWSQQITQEDPVVIVTTRKGSEISVTTKYLSTLNRSLHRYWNTSKDSREIKVARVEQQLNLRSKNATYKVSADTQAPQAGCTVGQPTVTGTTICPGTAATLYASPASPGTTVKWYNNGGGYLQTGSPYQTPVLYGTTSYKVTSYFNDGMGTFCESTMKTVTVTVSASAAIYEVYVGTPPNATGKYCATDMSTFPPISTSGSTSGLQYRLYYNGSSTGVLAKTGNGSAVTWSSNEITTGIALTGTTHSFQVKVTNGACEQAMENAVTVTAYTAPAVFTVQGAGPQCGSGTVYLGGAGGESGVQYQLLAGGVPVPGVPPEEYLGTPISWTGLSAGTYTVTASRVDCPSLTATMTGSAAITVSALPEAVITGESLICSGQSGTLLTAQTGAGYSYVWGLNGTTVGNTASYFATTSGTYELTVTVSGCSATATHDLVIANSPSAITGVAGLTTSFPGESTLIELIGSSDATNFVYSCATAAINVTDVYAYGNVEGRKVKLSLSSVGTHTVTVSPYNAGCVGTPYNFTYTVLNPASSFQQITMYHTEMNALSSGYLFLPKHSLNTYTGCIDQLGPVSVFVTLDLGDDYNLGSTTFSAAVNATVTAYSDLPGVTQSWTVPFSINENGPEQLFTKKITVNPALIRFIKVQINAYANATTSAQAAIRLKAYYKEEDVILGTGKSVTLISPGNGGTVNNGKWEQTFTWSSCQDLPDYVFQLLRVYDETVSTPPTDWSQALSIETESSATSLTLSLPEGSGKYWWRVVPIGNQTGGIANGSNWGTPSEVPFYFTYVHPEPNRNWIYSRTFTEGNRMSEQVTYANGLLQVAQEQTRIPDNNQIIAIKTLQDFTGRNALVSLPIPTGLNGLGYVGMLLKKDAANAYGVEDFDADNTIMNPVTALDYSGYYSGTDNTFNSGVASAEGYPYTRTRFAPDGTVREQSGVGLKHSIAGGKTVKTYYSTPTEADLARVFGLETPDVKSVQKVTNIDANGTTTVSFMNKDGKVLATALEVRTSAEPLGQLPSYQSGGGVTYEELKGFERINDRTIATRKPLFFSKPTTVTLDYEITPGLLNEICAASSNNQLVGYYPFNNNSNDQSGRNNHATRGGTITLTSDAFGNQSAYIANGGSGYMSIPDAADNDFGSSDFTVAIWVKRTSNTISWDNSAAIGKWNSMGLPGTNEWALYLTSNGSDNIPTFYVESGTTTYKALAGSPLSLATWYHLAGVRKGNQLLIYINGVLSGSTTIPVNTVLNSTSGLNVWISRYINSYTAATFDDVQIYRRALSSDEIVSLQSRGTICKTCDYKVELLLFTEGVDVPQTLQPATTISAGLCADQLTKKWDPLSFPIALNGETKYVIEKRITLETADGNGVLYVDAHASDAETQYRAQLAANPILTQINTFIANNQLAQLKAYLTSPVNYYNSTLQQYIIPVGVTGGCADYVYIPDFEVCPSATVDYSNCKRNGQTFWEYFESYYGVDAVSALNLTPAERLQFFQNDDAVFTDQKFLYFNNRLLPTVSQKTYFTKAEFDQMVVNMINDNNWNGGLTCQKVWEEWEKQVKSYIGNSKRDMNVNTGQMDGEGGQYADDVLFFGSVTGQEYSLFESFLRGVDALLQESLADPGTATDICPANPYFVKRTELYGKFKATPAGPNLTVDPNLLYAYKLVYYDHTNEEQNKALKFYRGLPTYTLQQIESSSFKATKADFDLLTLCEQYKFYTNTKVGTGAPQTEEQVVTTFIGQLRKKCWESCEGRAAEFRSKIIQSLLMQNGSTLIENYKTYINPALDGDLNTQGIQPMWVGIYDPTVNTTGYTVSKCEFDAMVNALVENCMGYCNTPLTVHDENFPNKPGFKVRVYGTDEERLRIKQAMTYDFDVTTGSGSCGPGWDFLPGASSGSSWMNAKTMYGHQNTPSMIIGADYSGFYLQHMQTGASIFKSGSQNVSVTASPFKYAALSKFTKDGDFVFFNSLPVLAGNTTPVAITNLNPTQFFFTHYAGNASTLFEASTPRLAFTSGLQQGVAAGLDANGQLTWVASTPRTDNQIFYNNVATPQLKALGNFYYVTNSDVGQGFTIVKRNSSGQLIWETPAIQLRADPVSNGSGFVPTISVDDAGNVYCFAYTQLDAGGTSIRLSIGGQIIQTTAFFRAIFLLKFNADGTLGWNKIYNHQSATLPGYSAGIGLSNSVLFSVDQLAYKTITGINMPGNPLTDFGFLEFDASTGNILWDMIAPVQFPLFKRDTKFKKVYALGQTLKLYSFDYQNHTSSLIKTISMPAGVIGYPIWFDYNPALSATKMLIAASTIPATIGSFSIQNYSTPNHVLLLEHKDAVCARRPICFQFTTTKNPLFTIPPELADVTYNPQKIECTALIATNLTYAIEQQKEQIISSKVSSLREQYYKQCGDPSLIQDKLSLSYVTGLHHYTLYYYDRAGNLMRTVPPEGVDAALVGTAANLSAAKAKSPRHLMVTEYQYNSIGQLVREHTPDNTPKPNNLVDRPLSTLSDLQIDADTYYATFIYNSKGLIRFSRNTQQKDATVGSGTGFSYTKYDEIGRVIEVGEANPPTYDYNALYAGRDQTGSTSYPTANVSQVTRTFYTTALNQTGGYTSLQLPVDPRTNPALPDAERRYKQRNLRNRVSFSVLDEDGNPATSADNVITVHSYDPHGNVEWLAQLIPGMETRVILYDYDLISRNVKQVSYSPGNADQFFHKYEYDANNRIRLVYTSSDGELWHKESTYDYYLHGPLKRTVIGEDKVQGLDYTYTVHGWLKGINHPVLTTMTNDPGQDGTAGSIVGRDIFGMTLGYYVGDYVRAGSSIPATNPTTAISNVKDLFNGNISNWSSNIGEWASSYLSEFPGITTTAPVYPKYRQFETYVFGYDELNRMTASYHYANTTFTYQTTYRTLYEYAPISTETNWFSRNSNGNIYRAQVWDNNAQQVDNVLYKYPIYQDPLNGNKWRLLSNRLLQASEQALSSASTTDDIEPGQATDNYQYDNIGNLIRDRQQLRKIEWTPYGKVKRVNVTLNDANGTLTGAYTEFRYDATGNRIMKKRVNVSGAQSIDYYVRDAEGNVMAVYHQENPSGSTGPITTSEVPLYGSARIGMYKKAESVTSLFTAPADGIYTRLLDKRTYEITDHLENIRAVVSDRKLSTLTGTVPGSFRPKVMLWNHYFPFGMEQPERNWTRSGEKYRYAFNGKEKDTDPDWGTTSIYDYGFRIYNPALGKFLSVDPLTKSYPMLTPYQFAANSPISAVDLDGLEILDYRSFYRITYSKTEIGLFYFASSVSGFFRHLYPAELFRNGTELGSFAIAGGWTIGGNVDAKALAVLWEPPKDRPTLKPDNRFNIFYQGGDNASDASTTDSKIESLMGNSKPARYNAVAGAIDIVARSIYFSKNDAWSDVNQTIEALKTSFTLANKAINNTPDDIINDVMTKFKVTNEQLRIDLANYVLDGYFPDDTEWRPGYKEYIEKTGDRLLKSYKGDQDLKRETPTAFGDYNLNKNYKEP